MAKTWGGYGKNVEIVGKNKYHHLDFDVLAKARLQQQVAMQVESDGHLRLKSITMRRVQQRED